MSILKLSRKNIFAIFAGFITILLVVIIVWAFSFLISLRIFGSVTTVSDISSAYSQQPYAVLMQILGVISFLLPAIGGFVVGWIVKEKGWLYGGILGILLKIISISISVLLLSVIQTPNLMFEHMQELARTNILSQVLSSPITIILSALGGFFGEFIHKKIKKEKFPLSRKNIVLIVLLVVVLMFYIKYNSVIISILSPIFSHPKNQSLTEKSENIKNTPIPEFTDLEIEYINSKSGIMEGQVTDLALKPLRDVSIFEQYRKMSTQTDEKGHYIFENVSPGQVTLTLTLPGYMSPGLSFSINAGMKLKRNLTMNTIGTKAGGVEGVVNVNGVPQKDIDVFTFLDGKIIKTKTDINGKYTLQDIPPTAGGEEYRGDKYRIVASISNYAPISKFIEVSSGVNTKQDFAFSNKLKGISIIGYITDDQGNNIRSDIVTSTKTSTYTTTNNVTIRFTYRGSISTQHTDSTGFYGQTGVDWQIFPLPSRIAIEVSAPGYRTIHDEISPKQGTSYIQNYTLKKE